mmetsp:Transcript_12798/g.21203  ORF Transcript_12798/g.21203 Transcript_12798/m.21203 type:complete len:333 (+) Transcript_12798:147-1145(+)
MVLSAVSMLCWQFATNCLHCLLDCHLGIVDVGLVVEDKILMIDVAAKMGVDQAMHDRIFGLWQAGILGEGLWQGVVNGQTLLPQTYAVGPKGRRHGEAEEHGTLRAPRVFAHMKPDRLWMLRLKFLQARHQVFDLSVAVFGEFHQHVVIELVRQLLELRGQRLGQDVVEPPKELVADDGGKRHRNRFDEELEIPQWFQIHHAQQLDHLDQDSPTLVDCIIGGFVDVLTGFGHLLWGGDADLALQFMRQSDVLAGGPDRLHFFGHGKGVVQRGQDQHLALRAVAVHPGGVRVETGDLVFQLRQKLPILGKGSRQLTGWIQICFGQGLCGVQEI